MPTVSRSWSITGVERVIELVRFRMRVRVRVTKLVYQIGFTTPF